MLIKFWLSVWLLMPISAYAAMSAPKEVLYQLETAVQRGDEETIRFYLSDASQPLFQRFWRYDLQGCIPYNASYMGEKQHGNVTYVKAGITSNGYQEFAELAFIKERGQWKLDLPESFRSAWDENWQQRLDQAELVYVTMKSQLGDQLNCDTLRGLVNG